MASQDKKRGSTNMGPSADKYQAKEPEEVEEKTKEKTGPGGATREELYHSISKNAELSNNFLLLVFLSTIVAAIGLIENNMAVVIGAMVIAPLLGPNIALALAAADRDQAVEPVDGHLQHRSIAEQREQLFRLGCGAGRPEALAVASGEDDGVVV